jgi:hypothetical protein
MLESALGEANLQLGEDFKGIRKEMVKRRGGSEGDDEEKRAPRNPFEKLSMP